MGECPETAANDKIMVFQAALRQSINFLYANTIVVYYKHEKDPASVYCVKSKFAHNILISKDKKMSFRTV